MIHTATKLPRALCSIAVVLALAAGITAVPAYALSNGVYTATSTPHYRHPVTGQIEDSGGEASAVLGQSMTDSATDPHALVEVDESGEVYITLRLMLSQYTQNQQFQVDGERNGTYTPVTATVMQEDYNADTTDYRMKVPSENAIIRCTMYVIPMGRDVVWYITLSDLKSGSGDFITSIQADPAAQPGEPVSSSLTEQTGVTEQTEAVTAGQPSVSIPDSPSGGAAAGIQEFDAAGNSLGETAPSDDEAGASRTGWIIGGAAAVLIAAGAGIWYFAFFRKKRGGTGE